MPLLRRFILLNALLIGIIFATNPNLTAQPSPTQEYPTAGTQPVLRQTTAQNPAIQQQIIQQPRIQQPPLKADPLMMIENGNIVRRQPQQPAQQTQQPITQQQQIQQPNYQNGFRVATTQTSPLQTVPTSNGSIPLYQPNLSDQPNNSGQSIPVAQAPTGQQLQSQQPQGMVRVGHSEPQSRIVPFFLSPAEQKELDDFLVRWEKYSSNIQRYDVDFDMFIYDPAIPGSEANKPYKVTFGYFKYIKNPMRFVYHVEGEYQQDKQVKRNGDKNPQIYAEKMIIDEKTVFKYDHNANTVLQVNVPPEMIGKGIADSPLPLIFGAKASDLKRRFSMKLAQKNPNQVQLECRPLLFEDQQEFSKIDIILDTKTLQAIGLRKYEINGQAYKVYSLKSPKINDRLGSILDDLKTWFSPTIEKGWKHEVMNWVATQPQQEQRQIPAVNQPNQPVSNRTLLDVVPQQTQRNEIPLYRVQ